MRGIICGIISMTTLLVMLAVGTNTPTHGNDSSNTLVDISWPNCKVNYVNSASGVVGINGGLDFHYNKCLYKESSLFSTYAVYLNTGYPGTKYGEKYSKTPDICGPDNSLCLAYNYGYNTALDSIKYASAHDVHSNLWWLDVETSNSWTSDFTQNRAEISGMIAAIYAHAVLPKVGIYSYPGQWNLITNNWHIDLLSWLATGTDSHASAIKACHSAGFDGGDIMLSQYTTKLDHNYVCQNSYNSLLKF